MCSQPAKRSFIFFGQHSFSGQQLVSICSWWVADKKNVWWSYQFVDHWLVLGWSNASRNLILMSNTQITIYCSHSQPDTLMDCINWDLSLLSSALNNILWRQIFKVLSPANNASNAKLTMSSFAYFYHPH